MAKIGDMKYVVWQEGYEGKKGKWYNMNIDGKDKTNDIKLAHLYTFEEAVKFVQEDDKYTMTSLEEK